MNAVPEKNILATNLKIIRRRRHLSQFEFAEECGISKESLCRLECGKGNPTLETLQLIAAYSGCTVSELLSPRISHNKS